MTPKKSTWTLAVTTAFCVLSVLTGCDTSSPENSADTNPPSAASSTNQAEHSIPFVTTAEFDQEVLQSDVPVLVDFYADWCGPCKIQGKILDKLAPKLGNARIVKVDVDKEPDLAQRYEISSIPTLIVVKEGEVAERHVGVTEADVLLADLE